MQTKDYKAKSKLDQCMTTTAYLLLFVLHAETVYHLRIQAGLVLSSLCMFNSCHVMNYIDGIMISCNILSHGFLRCEHKVDRWDKKLSSRFRSLDWRLASSPPITLKTSVSSKSLLRSEPEVPRICFTVASPSAICRET